MKGQKIGLFVVVFYTVCSILLAACWKGDWALCLGKDYQVSGGTMTCTKANGEQVELAYGEFTSEDVWMPVAVPASVGKSEKVSILWIMNVPTYYKGINWYTCENYTIANYRIIGVWCQGASWPDPNSADCCLV